jgi:hypothetical protein
MIVLRGKRATELAAYAPLEIEPMDVCRHPSAHETWRCWLFDAVGSIPQHQPRLATTTIERYRTVAGRFLHERFGHGKIDLRALRAADVIAFVQRQTRYLQCVVTAMRLFLGYAQYRGEVTTALAAAVPIAAAWTTTPALYGHDNYLKSRRNWLNFHRGLIWIKAIGASNCQILIVSGGPPT